MQFEDFVKPYRGKKVPADIQERWKTRVVNAGLEKLGEEGAKIYLDIYGKGIAAPKCALLALQAENVGYPAVALGFWKKAAVLLGCSVDWPGEVEQGDTIPLPEVARINDVVDEFPQDMQPGFITPMQPVDGKQSRDYYIHNPSYCGQPKRDGNKLLVFSTANMRWYQSRSMKLRAAPSREFDDAMRKLAVLEGPFIVEGELFYLDYAGGEHRTAAQAMEVNAVAGVSALPVMQYMSFVCLFYKNDDLRDATYADRVRYNEELFSHCGNMNFYAAPTARATVEKEMLARTQQAEGREGEVWFRWDLAYEPSKSTADVFVRTKYLTEFQAIVTALTPTTAEGRLFGAIEISDLNGKPIGSIGTGFDYSKQVKIVERFNTGKLIIPVVCQGFTEYGIAYLPRLSEEYN